MVDINCDMGEGMANDAALMAYISSANIACGFHAGSPEIMRQTIALCMSNHVAVGAHPSFNDRANFGRTELNLSTGEIIALVSDQLQLINAACNEMGAALHHVKPHGALYNMAARDAGIAAAITEAVATFDDKLYIYGLAGSYSITEAKKKNMRTVSEVFADRTYQADGSLTPRTHTNALIKDNDKAIAQVLQMIVEKKVTTVQGTKIDIDAASICIHGDGEHALDIAKQLYKTLQENNIRIGAY